MSREDEKEREAAAVDGNEKQAWDNRAENLDPGEHSISHDP